MELLYEKLKKLVEETELGNKNKLDSYEQINGTSLFKDIKYLGSLEEFWVGSFCQKEIDYIEGKNPRKKVTTNITFSKERNIFTKIFIRDYLKNTGKRYDLCLPNNLSAAVLFRDFASGELKADKEFVSTIIKLDGRYLPYMDNQYHEDYSIFKTALITDTSMYMESFLKCNTKLRRNPSFALLFFKGLINNNNNLSADTICRIFLAKGLLEKDEIEYNSVPFINKDNSPNVFVKINGKIEWIGDNYLEKLADVFTEMEYNSWMTSTEFLQGITALNPRFGAHVVNNILPLPHVVLNSDTKDNQKTKVKIK